MRGGEVVVGSDPVRRRRCVMNASLPRLLAALTVLAALAACSADPGPLVPPGTVVMSDPNVRWVARIAWSGDGGELAFLGAATAGPMLTYRVALEGPSTRAEPIEGLRDASELRYLPGTRDLVVAGATLVSPDADACDRGAVVLLPEGAAPIAVACPFDPPYHVLGRARAGAVAAVVDPDQFVAVDAAGGTVAVPVEGSIVRVELATLASEGLGQGIPVTYDPGGERLVVVDFDAGAWALQPWRLVDVADGSRVPLPIDEARFERGFHVFGVRWLDALVLLIERDLEDGAEWALWEVERDAWRVLGRAREGVGAFPLGQVPRWSASGRTLAFRTYECVRPGLLSPECAEPRWSIVVVDVETGARTLAYRGRAFVDAPVIAPDDRAVAYAVDGVIYRKALP